jgi:hypothetical protein
MTELEKQQVKAEMKALIAYRYNEMLKRYGGVPLLSKSLTASDEILIPRSSVQDVLNFIVKLCNEASTELPDSYPANFKGRITKGVALAIKAEALMYAARPLFNSSTPYMNLEGHNELLCLGDYNQSRWQDAIDASEAVITWATSNGYQLINTGNPLDDYGIACSLPNNSEILLACNLQNPNTTSNGNYYDPRGQSGAANGMSFNQLTKYLKADGTEQTWPGTGDVSYSDYNTKIEQMEPRYKASAMGAGINAWNNPNDNAWSSSVMSFKSTWEGQGGSEACGRRVKFWWKAGNRVWFNFPIYRLAEFYLNLAEAYNEMNNPTKALENLKKITDRAGLPAFNNTNQSLLRAKIQREWAVEFYEENHRLHDVKHWKLNDIGGPRQSFVFKYKNGSSAFDAQGYLSYSVQTLYNAYWSPKQFLNPFPIKEANIGYLLQNPGY